MIQFTKMHGLGNDFIVVNTINQSFDLKKFPIKKLANRHSGIGFDQLLLLSKNSTADFTCRFFNADGSEAEQCGNGLRCIARYIHEEKLSSKSSLKIETLAGIMDVTLRDFNHIEVLMGKPEISSLNVLDQALMKVNLGNPHVILMVNSIENAPVDSLGAKLSTHSTFPNGINVGFVEIKNRQRIQLRTFERGTGETFACGSNACAAVVAGISNQLLDTRVSVVLPYGELFIEWQNPNAAVKMTGPAERVFSGILSSS